MPWILIRKGLFAHPIRSLLTLGALTIAVFLICILRSLLVALDAGIEQAASNRLIVQSAVSLFVNLPVSYQGKMDTVAGVESSCKLQWFGGVYRDPSNFFAQFACDEDRMEEMYPELELVQGSWEDFQADRRACIVGEQLLGRFGWSVGDLVPLIGTIFPRSNGEAWEFQIAGVYRCDSSAFDQATMFFHFDYLEESLEAGAADGPPGSGVFILQIAPGAEPTRIMADVDALFENGPQRVQTTTEAEFQRQFVSMLGNVPTFLGAIGGGVLFSIALAVLNTMLMASRERTRQLGILKALGFTDTTAFVLMLSESLVLCTVGGLAGAGLAKAAEAPFTSGFVGQMFPGFSIPSETLLFGLGLALAIGLAAGIVPALTARRLRPVEAFRMEG